MIKVKAGTNPTAEIVTKIISKFKKSDLPRFNRLESYYMVQNKILLRQMESEKPNNKIAHGFAKYITNMATGYFMGEGLRNEVDDDEYSEKLTEVLEQNMDDIHFELMKETSKKGISYELLYMDEKSNIRFRKFNAEEIIPVYSFSVGEFLEFAIRIWQEDDFMTDETIDYAAVYTQSEIITFKKTADRDKYAEDHREAHNFDDVPVIVYWNNEEMKGDYEDVITLIDAYDKTQSDTANDFEYFTDAYLVLVGAGEGLIEANEDGDYDKVKAMRQQRILALDEKGQAEWLIKNVNDTAVENYKNRIYRDIFFLSLVPALTDESFAGNLTGVAIKYKLIGLEQLAAMKEYKFIPSYKKKIRMITRQLNIKYNRNYNPQTVKTTFDRNMTDNLKELAEIVALLDGIISKETQLSLLPFIKDVKEEFEKILKDRLKDSDFEDLGMIDEDKVKAYVQS